MPGWRKKRRLRLHLEGMDGSVEGVFVGFWAGHYILRVPTYVTDQGSESLEGHDVKVPRRRVLFAQEI